MLRQDLFNTVDGRGEPGVYLEVGTIHMPDAHVEGMCQQAGHGV